MKLLERSVGSGIIGRLCRLGRQTLPFCLVWLSVAALGSAARADVITVGAEAGCDVASIGSAISLAAGTSGADEIRLNFANEPGYANTQLLIRDFGTTLKGELAIVGGFSSCSDTTPLLTPVAVAGAAGAPIFRIDTSAGDSIVTLRNLNLRFGEGGLLIEGDSTVTLDNTDVQSNTASGITIGGGAALTLGGESGQSRIANNQTPGFGGGVNCSGASVEAKSASISSNHADLGGGGGIYSSGCLVTLRKDAFVSGNSAIDGGGIYADRASVIVLEGAADGQPALGGNNATDDGGGIYAKNAGTVVAFINARIIGNTAVRRGGGIFVDEGAVLSMQGTEASCRRPLSASLVDECSQLHANTLTDSGGLGAAIYLGNGASGFVTRTYVERNATVGSMIHAAGNGTVATLEGLSVTENEVGRLYTIDDEAGMTAGFVSANNNTFDCGAPAPCDSGIARVTGSASLSMHSSIYWPAGAVSWDAGSTLDGNCLMVTAASGLAGILPNTVSGVDPLFRDPASGDLSLLEDSPAVDYCDDGAYAALASDIDLETRGQDWPGNENGSPGVPGGLFDLGMDELGIPEVIFADGFESLGT